MQAHIGHMYYSIYSLGPQQCQAVFLSAGWATPKLGLISCISDISLTGGISTQMLEWPFMTVMLYSSILLGTC